MKSNFVSWKRRHAIYSLLQGGKDEWAQHTSVSNQKKILIFLLSVLLFKVKIQSKSYIKFYLFNNNKKAILLEIPPPHVF